jgi:aryl-alcohol dehydrogenase-like predicted oxidoreductase
MWASDVHGLVSYVSLQPHYNLVHRAEFEREMADLVTKYAIGVIPYSPLAGGYLTGKYRPDQPLPDSARAGRIRERYLGDTDSSGRYAALLDGMAEIGQTHGQGIAQVALAWLLSNPLVTAPIIGANSVEQLQDSLAAIGFRLSEAEVEVLNELSDWRGT